VLEDEFPLKMLYCQGQTVNLPEGIFHGKSMGNPEI
jgi:hypothetical protein